MNNAKSKPPPVLPAAVFKSGKAGES